MRMMMRRVASICVHPSEKGFPRELLYLPDDRSRCTGR